MSSTEREETKVAPAEGEVPAQKYPPGVVLGKDGKPCRACNSKAAFSSMSSMLGKQPKAAASATSASTTTKGLPADCPPDVEELGNSSWTLLHSIAASYPENPSAAQKEDLRGFMRTFSRLYPCWVCAEDFQAYAKRDQPKVENREEFGNWLCEAHNEVNRKLGKREFDCSKWEQRWRTGWKDGRCD